MIEQNAQYQFAMQGVMNANNLLFRTQAELAEARMLIGKLNAEIEELKKQNGEQNGTGNGNLQRPEHDGERDRNGEAKVAG